MRVKNKRILFVCTGNTCRSPMAEIILKNKFKLAGVKNVKVSSAGLYATDGDKMSGNSFRALKLMGYKPYGFKSRQINEDIIKKSDLILCMTANHKLALMGIKSAVNKVYTISEATGLGDISDPYGGDINVYIKTSHQIEDACNFILEQILIKQGE